MKTIRYVLINLLAAVLCGGRIFAAEGFDESVDRNAPNFVHASVLVCGPSTSLYGGAGHAAIRLQCPHYELDEVFSYEGEPIKQQVLRFFLGELKMGMFATPFKTFLKDYAADGRSVSEYPISLSPQAKVRLWKLMDDRIAEGAYLPYDHIRKGCAQTALKNILLSIAPEPISVGELPPKFGRTRREILHDYLIYAKWPRLMLHLITGPNCNLALSSSDLVIVPEDMIDYLLATRVNGIPVIISQPIEHLPQTLEVKSLWNTVSPMVVACLLLVLSIIGCFVGKRWIHAALLMLYALLAVFETYISVFSSLPCAAWNVLLIVFNPLPLVFWKWRKYWGLPYAAVLIVWSAWVFLAPHLPTDPAFAILALAYSIIFYFRGRH